MNICEKLKLLLCDFMIIVNLFGILQKKKRSILQIFNRLQSCKISNERMAMLMKIVISLMSSFS